MLLPPKVEPTRTSGTDTIDNIRYQTTTYFVYGFSFSKAKLVSTNLNPGPDISIDVNKGNVPPTLLFQANNQKPSFYKTGDFADEASAISAYNNIKTVSVTQWQDMADPVNPNQVWIYRTGTDTYAKIRIISTVNETRQGIALMESAPSSGFISLTGHYLSRGNENWICAIGSSILKMKRLFGNLPWKHLKISIIKTLYIRAL